MAKHAAHTFHLLFALYTPLPCLLALPLSLSVSLSMAVPGVHVTWRTFSNTAIRIGQPHVWQSAVGSGEWGVSWMSLRRLYVVHVSGRGLYVGLIGFADANEESNF